MDESRVRAWFDRCLSTSAARASGASDDVSAPLELYGVPLLGSTDEAAAHPEQRW